MESANKLIHLLFLLFISSSIFQISQSQLCGQCPEKWEEIPDCDFPEPPPSSSNNSHSNGTTESIQSTITTSSTVISPKTSNETTTRTTMETTTRTSMETTTHISVTLPGNYTCCKLNETLRCQYSASGELFPACSNKNGSCESNIEGAHCAADETNKGVCERCKLGSYLDTNTADRQPKCRSHCHGTLAEGLHWYNTIESGTDYSAGTCETSYGWRFYLIIVLPSTAGPLLIIIIVVAVVMGRRKCRQSTQSDGEHDKPLPTRDEVNGTLKDVTKRIKEGGMMRQPSKPNSYVVGAQVQGGERVASVNEEDEYSEPRDYVNDSTIEEIQRQHAQRLNPNIDRVEQETSFNDGEQIYQNTAPGQEGSSTSAPYERENSFEDSYENQEFGGNTAEVDVRRRVPPANPGGHESQASYTDMNALQANLQGEEEDEYTPPSDGGRSDGSHHSTVKSEQRQVLERLNTALAKKLAQRKEQEYDYAANQSRGLNLTQPTQATTNMEQLYTGDRQGLYADDETELASYPQEQTESPDDPIYENNEYANRNEQNYDNLSKSRERGRFDS